MTSFVVWLGCKVILAWLLIVNHSPITAQDYAGEPWAPQKLVECQTEADNIMSGTRDNPKQFGSEVVRRQLVKDCMNVWREIETKYPISGA